MTEAESGLPAPGPLTYEQEWYLRRVRGSTYTRRNVRLCYRILGPLDTERFEEAVRLFVTRHDALRMALVPSGSDAPATAQRLLPIRPDDRPIDGQHVTAVSTGQFSHYAAALFSRDVITPFADRGRPFSLRLLRHDPEHHAFLATFDNVFFDGRAHDLFSREVWRDYAALGDTAADPPPVTAPSFARAARDQREGRGPRRLERARASWQRRTEFAAGNRWRELDVAPTASGSVHATIPEALLEALREYCRQARCTVMHWLVGSFARSLATHAGQRRLSLWTSLDSRPPAERDTVGMFAGPAPLAIGAPGAALPEVVAEVGAAMVDALRHQQLPAAELAALLGTPPGPGAAAGAIARDVYVNLRSFPGSVRPPRGDSTLRITPDAYPLRRIALVDSSALHLRCNEYRDAVMIDLVFDGRRVGEPLARAIADQITSDAAAVTGRRPSSERPQ
ncbi:MULTISPECIES: condensation domain-containing protein [unclassified Streptomyces]|uniref:condensation domain-containing protein n=1 Tax=unclassified Streptomyces TaxID=2593676 RepID=UPI0037FC3669